jgi:hypothetical protein
MATYVAGLAAALLVAGAGGCAITTTVTAVLAAVLPGAWERWALVPGCLAGLSVAGLVVGLAVGAIHRASVVGRGGVGSAPPPVAAHPRPYLRLVPPLPK